MIADNISCNVYSENKTLEQIFTQYVLSWMFLLLSILGLTGATVCLVVLLKYPVFSHSTKCWFVSLLTTDILILLLPGMDLYFYLIFPMEYPLVLVKLGIFGCEIRWALIQSLSWLPNLLQSSLSIERSYSVLRPMHAKVIFTKSRTKLIIIILVVLSIVSGVLTNGLTFTRQVLNNSSVDCVRVRFEIASINISNIIYNIDLFCFRIVPFTIMFVSSCIIIVKLKCCGKAKRTKFNIRTKNTRTTSNKELKMFILLISMNVLTLVTNPLFALFEMIDGVGSEGYPYGLWTGDICVSNLLRLIFNCAIYFNNQSNWIFYISSGAKFRRYSINILRALFGCSQVSSNSSKRTRTNLSYGMSLTSQSKHLKMDYFMTSVP